MKKVNNFYNNLKNSQVSIFIVIGIILFLGVLFLILSSSSQEQQQRDLAEQISTAQEFNIFNLQESAMSCLRLSTRKALLLVSARGGLIYPREESIEFLTAPNSLELTPIFAQNLGLEVASIDQFIFPGLTENLHISTAAVDRSEIIKDIKHYIVRDFVNCHSVFLEGIDYTNITYSIVDTSSRRSLDSGEFAYRVDNLKIEEGGNISLFLENGSIVNGTYISPSSEVLTSVSLAPGDNVVAVVEEFFQIRVDVSRSMVTSRIIAPDSFQAGNTQFDQNQIQATIQTPLFSLINNMRTLLTAKFFNRSIEFNNSNHLSDINFNMDLSLSINTIQREEGIIFQILKLGYAGEGTFEFDEFVSLYRNTAPIISQDSIEVRNDINANLLLNDMYFGGDRNNISDNEREFRVVVYSERFKGFEDNEVKLFQNGTFELKVNSGTFMREFYATDGELYTPFVVNFNLGEKTNVNNIDVGICIDVTYSLSSLASGYDSINEFIDPTTRKVHLRNRISNTGEFEWFGVVASGSTNVVANLTPNPDCFTGPTPPSQTVSLSSSGPNNPRFITIPNPSGDRDFTLTLGATDCLGPSRVTDNTGFGSCCNFPQIQNLLSVNDFSTLYSTNFILPSGTIGFLSDTSRVCIGSEEPSQRNHWNNLSFLRTQFMSSQIKITCLGQSPILEENLIETQGQNDLAGIFDLIHFQPDIFGSHFSLGSNILTGSFRFNTTQDSGSPTGFIANCLMCESGKSNAIFEIQRGDGLNISIGTNNVIPAPDGIVMGDRFNGSFTSSGDSCEYYLVEPQCQGGVEENVPISGPYIKTLQTVNVGAPIDDVDANDDPICIQNRERQTCQEGFPFVPISPTISSGPC